MNDEIILDKFAERFGKLIKENETDINFLLNMLGIKSKSTIYRYLNAEMAPKITTIKYLAEYYNVNPIWLMGYDVSKSIQKIDLNSKQTYPLLGTVRAGYNYLANENIIGYITLDRKVSDPENCYALKIKGDSMQPVLYENDIVVVHKQNDIESGKIGIVIVDNEEATIKKIVKTQEGLELHALNPYYPVRRFSFKDIERIPVKIIGKVIEGRIYGIFE